MFNVFRVLAKDIEQKKVGHEQQQEIEVEARCPENSTKEQRESFMQLADSYADCVKKRKGDGDDAGKTNKEKGEGCNESRPADHEDAEAPHGSHGADAPRPRSAGVRSPPQGGTVRVTRGARGRIQALRR